MVRRMKGLVISSNRFTMQCIDCRRSCLQKQARSKRAKSRLSSSLFRDRNGKAQKRMNGTGGHEAIRKERYKEAVEEALLKSGCPQEDADLIIIYYLSPLLESFPPEQTMSEPPAETAALLKRVYDVDKRAGAARPFSKK